MEAEESEASKDVAEIGKSVTTSENSSSIEIELVDQPNDAAAIEAPSQSGDKNQEDETNQQNEEERDRVEVSACQSNDTSASQRDNILDNLPSSSASSDNLPLPEPQALMIDEGTRSPIPAEPVTIDAVRKSGENEHSDTKSGPEVAEGQSEKRQNLGESDTAAHQDDDEVIVVEARIKTIPNINRSGQNAAAISDGLFLSGSNEVALPQLLKTVTVNSSEANAISTAAVDTRRQSMDTGQSARSIAPATTSVASVLKALAASQGASSGNGSRLAAPRLSLQSAAGAALKAIAPAPPPPVPVIVTTAATISTVQLHQNGGRQILPKPVGVVNANIANVGSSPRGPTQQQKAQESPQEAALSNGVSPKNTGQQDGLPSYLKSVLNPASVLPYRCEIPPKEHGFLTPDGGYQCEECGDTFALKTCLEFHLQRRSMIIESNCLVCRQPLVFFNKCVYFGHIRQHCGNHCQVGILVMRNVNVKPITWKLMELAFDDTAFKRMMNIEEFVKYETGKPMLHVDAGDLIPATGSTEVAKLIGGDKAAVATSTLAAKFFKAAVGNTTDQQASAKVRCSECKMEFISPALLRHHFMYNLPPTQKQLICLTCQAVYFSQCSFKAHTRTHSKEAPFTCPECGSVEATHNLMSAHVLTHQKNPTVMDAWRCQKCLTFYSSWDALIIHIGATHCDSYYRCQHCPMAYQTAPAFEQHLQTQHDIVGGIRATDAQVLTKCCHCDVVYMAREPLLEHLKTTHCQKLMPFIVYRCALCGRLMENKGGLLGHFRNVHRLNVSPAEVFPVKIQISGNNSAAAKRSGSTENEKKSGPTASASTVTCPVCPNMLFNDVASLRAHLKRSHGSSTPVGMHSSVAKKPRTEEQDVASTASASATTVTEECSCRLCKRKFTSKDDLFEDGRRHLRDAVNVCLLCQNNDCGSPSLLSHHLLRHVEMHLERTSKQVKYQCEWHCGMTFPSVPEALGHLREFHLMAPLRCFSCEIDFVSEDELRLHSKRHAEGQTSSSQTSARAFPTPSPREAAQSGRIGESRKISSDTPSEVSPTPRQSSGSSSGSPGSIRCNKCGVWIHDIESMHAHAVSHKEAKYYLCLECGLSFAATTSLGRHLIVAHKISNVDKYLQDYPDSNPDKPSELECAVCHMEFPSKPLLDSHVRTHGLLFLKTKARPSI